MPLPLTLHIPVDNFSLTLEAGRTAILVGANGSGKSRLAAWIEHQLGMEAHRIGAQRSLLLNPDVPKLSEASSVVKLRVGVDAPTLSPEFWAGNRNGARWRGDAVNSMLEDFDALLQALFADESNVSATHRRAHLQNPGAQPPQTKFDKLQRIWERVLPARRLIISADSIYVEPTNGAAEHRYTAAALSDGERAAFYLIAQVLFAADGVVLIFDEPELHLHRAIFSRLWDELEAARPDCAFVLITHDLEFASARHGRKLVLLSYHQPDHWVIKDVPENSEFGEQLTTLILGSRRPVLFVEGESSSIDIAVYRACYPDWTVVPRGGCELVIHAVRTMRENAPLTQIPCAGIVDADSRSNVDEQFLADLGVEVLPVAEIENIFALPPVAKAIMDQFLFDEDDQQRRSQRLLRELSDEVSRPAVERAVAMRYVTRRMDRILGSIGLPDALDEESLAAKLREAVDAIDIVAIGADVRGALQKAVQAGDVTALLKVYDGKGKVLACTASALTDWRKDRFEAWIAKALQSPDKAKLWDAVTSVLPTPIAR